MSDHWFVYMIETEKQRLYTGISTDPSRRFEEHLSSFTHKTGRGAKFFRGDRPLKVVYQEHFSTRSEASKRESEIKKMSRKRKVALCEWDV